MAQKADSYEGGIREPLIAWAPGLIPASRTGSVNEKTVLASVDIAPSLLHLAGVAVPSQIAFDGDNLAHALLGKSEPLRQHPLIWVRPPDRPGPVDAPFPDVAIRDGKWKLLQQTDGSRAQLYDLAADPGEKRNRADEEKETVARLQDMWKSFQKTLPPKSTQTAPK